MAPGRITEQSWSIQTQTVYMCECHPLPVEIHVLCHIAASESGSAKPMWLLTYLWSHASCPLKPSYHPALSQLCVPNPINIFYAHSFFPPPPSSSSFFLTFRNFQSTIICLWPQTCHQTSCFSSLVFLQVAYTSNDSL